MSTRTAAAESAPRNGGAPASRIVRISRAAWPTAAASVLLLAAWWGLPRAAWLPWRGGVQGADAWQAPLVGAASIVASGQVALGRVAWPVDPVLGGIGVAVFAAAAWVLVQARAHRAAGLDAGLGALLALVASAAPLQAWQAASPLAAGPVTLVSGWLLWQVTRGESTRPATQSGGRPTAVMGSRALMGLFLLVAATTLVAEWAGAPHVRATLALLQGDLGLPGVVLLCLAIVPGQGAEVRHGRVWLGVLVLAWLTPTISPTVRAAALIPWAWCLVATGLARLLAWRGPHATRWAAPGLMAWAALHAAQASWGLQRQETALVRTWAESAAAQVSTTQPLVEEPSARGRLVSALVPEESVEHAGPTVVSADQARRATAEGRHPMVLGADDRERLRWNGVALAEWPIDAGVAIDRLLVTLPRGTIVLAAISRDAAAQLTPAQWQALGRVGLRLADASLVRAHAVVGVTHARADALEVAQAGAVDMVVVPGDPLGRTGARSPVDARLEADASHARVFLRNQPFLAVRGLALVFFTSRGDLLAWRSGRTPAHLDGPPLGAGPATAARAWQVLPCVDVPAGTPTDVSTVVGEPALGIMLGAASRLEVTFTRPAGFTTRPFLQPDGPGRAPTGTAFAAESARFSLESSGATQLGVGLGGPMVQALATSSAPARLCAAWPAVPVLDPLVARVDMPMAPQSEPYLGGGWHDAETLGNDRHFRWMAGAAATVLLPLRSTGALLFELDAKGVAEPAPTDHVRLRVNGHDAGTRPLLGTRGIYGWRIETPHLRPGLNTIMLETTQTLRPADRQAGADARLLGLAVHGWSIDRAPAAPSASPSTGGR